jgi:hypothetical protein
MPWNKVIWSVILLVIGLMAYLTYLQLGPDGLATATEAEAPARIFKKHMTSPAS